ncbi:hypothetical protein [Streptomyces tirandamycinicus]|uniref:Uncharacterized protein n=1 Tax=Streptomyces tirandamycinicus TaxID=2174846 RepID=A0A2S1T236_9ACTN|nr:hypothetical protein [Streptomyces tirandamycinicus]AWI32719.1 hypothetical protein DDW44_30875 [Streptomyces tirandamycinicus]
MRFIVEEWGGPTMQRGVSSLEPGRVETAAGSGKANSYLSILWDLMQHSPDDDTVDMPVFSREELDDRLKKVLDTPVEPLPEDIENLSDSGRFLHDPERETPPAETDPASVSSAYSYTLLEVKGARRVLDDFFLDVRDDAYHSYLPVKPNELILEALSAFKQRWSDAGGEYAAWKWNHDLLPWLANHPRTVQSELEKKVAGKLRREGPREKQYLLALLVLPDLGTAAPATVPTAWLDCSEATVHRAPERDVALGQWSVVVHVATDACFRDSQADGLRAAVMQLPDNLSPTQEHREDIKHLWETKWRSGVLKILGEEE